MIFSLSFKDTVVGHDNTGTLYYLAAISLILATLRLFSLFAHMERTNKIGVLSLIINIMHVMILSKTFKSVKRNSDWGASMREDSQALFSSTSQHSGAE